jgi:hypothetical protein
MQIRNDGVATNAARGRPGVPAVGCVGPVAPLLGPPENRRLEGRHGAFRAPKSPLAACSQGAVSLLLSGRPGRSRNVGRKGPVVAGSVNSSSQRVPPVWRSSGESSNLESLKRARTSPSCARCLTNAQHTRDDLVLTEPDALGMRAVRRGRTRHRCVADVVGATHFL